MAPTSLSGIVRLLFPEIFIYSNKVHYKAKGVRVNGRLNLAAEKQPLADGDYNGIDTFIRRSFFDERL